MVSDERNEEGGRKMERESDDFEESEREGKREERESLMVSERERA